MINQVVLVGRLTKDPELRYTADGAAVANITLAVTRNFAMRKGELIPISFNVHFGGKWRRIQPITAGKVRLLASWGGFRQETMKRKMGNEYT